MVFCFGAGGWVKPGVAGAAPEHPLEGVAKDPTGWGIWKTPTRMSGRDKKGGAGAEARGRLSPLIQPLFLHMPMVFL